YDLIMGLVGYGIYALERWPRGLSVRILQLVVEHLVAGAEPANPGYTWTTPPSVMPAYQRRLAPRGYRNLGLAHGIPGILALMARASRVGLLSDKDARVLEGGVEWLLQSQRERTNGLKYPSWIVAEEQDARRDGEARLGWCYGDLGVAAAMLVAGECHGRP